MCQDASGNPTVVEVDDDLDEGYGDQVSSASTSIRSSVMNYQWKHGRRFHSYQAGSYNFPNDEMEQDRLDLIHYAYSLLLDGRLFLAPIDPHNLNVLDIGTGTGLWPIDFGDTYPTAASVLGNDLSPIQPGWVPQNVKFLVDDVEAEWAESTQWDYIHCRYMAGSIKDWPRLVGQIYKHLRIGGWVEFQESANTIYSQDDTLKPDNALVSLMNGLMEACEKIGRTMDPAPSFKKWTEQAGFINIEEKRLQLPVGSWPKNPRLKEIGSLLSLNFHDGVDAFTAVTFTDILGWSRPEVELLNAEVRKATRSKEIHPLFDFIVVTAQKPA